MRRMRRLVIALGLLAMLGVTGTVEAQSPGAVQWSQPILLSGDVPKSVRPTVVADPFGRVHVFWEAGYTPFPQNPEVAGSVIYYTQYDGTRWTEPVDVFVSPGSYSLAYGLSATTDDLGYVYAAWVGNSVLYFTRAPIETANSARSWSPFIRIDESVQTPHLFSGRDGSLYLFYWSVSSSPGIYYARSSDGGHQWTSPVAIWQRPQGAAPPNKVDTIMAVEALANSSLHIIWSDIYGEAIYYARTDDHGLTWTRPVLLDEAGVYPSIGIDERGSIVALWSSSHDKVSCARYGRTSADGGRVWSELRRVLAPMEGCYHRTPFAVDGSGRLQLATVGRNKGVVGMYHSMWAGAEWLAPQSFTNIMVPDGPEWQDHGPDAMKLAIGSGNRFHVVWHQAGIWYVGGEGASPSIPARPLPTSVPEPTRAVALATTAAGPTVRAAQFPESDASNLDTRPGEIPLFAGIVPVIALIVLVLVSRYIGRAR